LTTVACSSGSDSEPTGESTLTLSLLPSTSFTRAINESAYTDVNNYTVELQQGDSIWSYLYRDMPLKMTIKAGDYRMTAHYGNNPVAVLDSLSVEGTVDFSVKTGETKTVNLTCVPANAKIAVKTSDDFATYFSDYQISVLAAGMTDALVYGKKDVETDGKDAYVRADKENGTEVTVAFTLTPAADVTVTRELESFTRTVKPQDCLTFTLKPDVTSVAGGTVSGITITIDDSVTTEDVNITLPNSWLY
jgi:hypothetical protein